MGVAMNWATAFSADPDPIKDPNPAVVAAQQPSKDALPLDIHVIIRKAVPAAGAEVTVGNHSITTAGTVAGAENAPTNPPTTQGTMPVPLLVAAAWPTLAKLGR